MMSWMSFNRTIPFVYAGAERKDRQGRHYCCYRRMMLFNRPCRNLGIFALQWDNEIIPVCLQHFGEMSTWLFLKYNHPEEGEHW